MFVVFVLGIVRVIGIRFVRSGVALGRGAIGIGLVSAVAFSVTRIPWLRIRSCVWWLWLVFHTSLGDGAIVCGVSTSDISGITDFCRNQLEGFVVVLDGFSVVKT